jgi:hypothetical protein
VGSADYVSYCETAPIVTPIPTPTPVVTPAPTTPTTNINPTGNNANGLSIAFFVKENSSSNQWQKTVQIGSNSQIYFMISETNSSAVQIDNVSVLANIPTEISSLGNLQLNGIPVSGDIVSGINIGSISPTTTKLLTFEGKTAILSTTATKQAIATSNISGTAIADSTSINLNPNQPAVTAAASLTPATSGFSEFLKHWYLWIIVGLVLVFLFIIVFRRLSSNV